MTTNEALDTAKYGEIEPKIAKWADLCIKQTFVVIIAGIILGAILWVAVDGATGEDLGALVWVLAGGGAIALISIRQALLEERV
ncbi:hypothetical protein [Corynebacterium renale]|uniref:Uncharacterized protein n=1 Tax=Corynebacterium renale TaxID=1724 RepID=A0A2A9DLI1_9CORY|nr:hypothetical protein [Corynebacterium renale]PFG27226.1 hypothetical protein ATK06_0277 [Corynebacterium renale]SQI23714.1 Uncharacterised protein [Corynebacterium renale]